MVSGGAVITKDGGFSQLVTSVRPGADSKPFLNTLTISGELITSSVDRPVMAKKKVGGAVYRQTRQELFEQVLTAYKNRKTNTDPALEVLVSLLKYSEKHDQKVAELVKSQLSSDTLTTLAVLLQPYKSGEHYLSDSFIESWAKKMSNANTDLFYYGKDMAKTYVDAMNSTNYNMSFVDTPRKALAQNYNLALIAGSLKNLYKNLDLSPLPQLRQNLKEDELLAEAELRVAAYNMGGAGDLSFYKDKYTLDKPYLCGVSVEDHTKLRSNELIILNSDAVLYTPNYGKGAVLISQLNPEMNVLQFGTVNVDIDSSSYDSTYNEMIDQIKSSME